MKVLLPYFFIVNTIAFILAGYDKYLAVKHKRRISENTLFVITALGGSLGLLLAMILFRHKTSKPSFMMKYAGIVLLQVIIAFLIFFYYCDAETLAWFMVSDNK
ncbi:DUF1294 domain-containing protein [Flavobacterium sp. LS1R47]|uniref:DUF1294 domain-containing protein n=1 Tax=Flavobacterium frigoritolerans TaxID=2987686 RepID=A0A9X2ZPE1_9FLAO|nr:DUF1294 domain-containing protein [Flavobacterium frigoritolerans]MCV9932316.1 DUF1294 domain-containing protein [Flavobacterium frigoritolerans]